MKKITTSSSKCNARTLFSFLIVSALIGWLFVQEFSYATAPEQHYVATVIEKKEIPTGGALWLPLVVTRLADGEEHIFQVTNSYSHLNFSSSKLYDSIEVGKTYTFNVYGYAKEDFQQYENILSVEEIASPTEEQP